jgi:hypothetical protein
MKMNRVIALICLLFYVGSFFLTAVKDSGATISDSGYRGYLCAWVTLLSPWGSDGMRMLRQGALEYFAILFSGWINPVFLVTAAMLWAKPNGRAGAFLRIVVVLMLPACWIVFHNEHKRPWIGYWLWTAAMLMALFSTMLARKDRDINAARAAA